MIPHKGFVRIGERNTREYRNGYVGVSYAERRQHGQAVAAEQFRVGDDDIENRRVDLPFEHSQPLVNISRAYDVETEYREGDAKHLLLRGFIFEHQHAH